MAHCQGHPPLAETVTAFRRPDWSPLCRDVTVARRRCAPPDWLGCVTSLSSSAGVGVVRRRAGLSFLRRCYSCYSNGACLPICFVVCSTHALTPVARIGGVAPPWKTRLLLIHIWRCNSSRRPQTALTDTLTGNAVRLPPFHTFLFCLYQNMGAAAAIRTRYLVFSNKTP